jgi:prefoldin subunit 5
MIEEIATAITSIKATLEMIKAAKSVVDSAEIDRHLTDLLAKLVLAESRTLALQSEHEKVIQEKNALSNKLLALHNWSKTEKRYSLQHVGAGVFVYVYNPSDKNTEPKHWACPRCWKESVNHILQQTLKTSSVIEYECPNCDKKFIIQLSDFSGSFNPPSGDWRVDAL